MVLDLMAAPIIIVSHKKIPDEWLLYQTSSYYNQTTPQSRRNKGELE
jgi:hypothetical protein